MDKEMQLVKCWSHQSGHLLDEWIHEKKTISDCDGTFWENTIQIEGSSAPTDSSKAILQPEIFFEGNIIHHQYNDIIKFT